MLKTLKRVQAAPRGGGNAFAHPRLDRVNTLRTVAIVGVFLYHAYSTVFQGSFEHVIEAAELWSRPVRAAALGLFMVLSNLDRLITLFFIVSGYFLHRFYLAWRARNAGESVGSFNRFFLWRRFWRLVPPFWVALLFSYAFMPHPFSWPALKTLLINALMIKTLVGGYFFSMNEAHWYVAAQWQLDLLYPVFLYMAVRWSFGWSFGVSCTFAVLFFFVVPQFVHAASILYLPFRWWADWATGALVAECHGRNRRLFVWPRRSLAAIVLLMAVAFYLPPTVSGIYLWFMIRVAMAYVLERLLVSARPLSRMERRLMPIGICSYSIYLFHLPLINFSAWLFRRLNYDPRLPSYWLAMVVFAFALTFVLSWISYLWVEEGSVKLGNRLWRKLVLPSATPDPRPAREPAA